MPDTSANRDDPYAAAPFERLREMFQELATGRLTERKETLEQLCARVGIIVKTAQRWFRDSDNRLPAPTGLGKEFLDALGFKPDDEIWAILEAAWPKRPGVKANREGLQLGESPSPWPAGSWIQEISGEPVYWAGRAWRRRKNPKQNSLDHVVLEVDPRWKPKVTEERRFIGTIRRLSPKRPGTTAWRITEAYEYVDTARTLFCRFREVEGDDFSRGFIALTMPHVSESVLVGLYVTRHSTFGVPFRKDDIKDDISASHLPILNDVVEPSQWHQAVIPRPVLWRRGAPPID